MGEESMVVGEEGDYIAAELIYSCPVAAYL